MQIKARKSRKTIRLFLLLCIATVFLAWIGHYLSGAYPWGIDDGVKRLTAKSIYQSGYLSAVLNPPAPPEFDNRYFPIPQPFAKAQGGSFIAIFPSLWPLLGGISYSAFGDYSFYIMPAISLISLLFLLNYTARRLKLKRTVPWILFITFSTFLFYGLTFWEHVLSIVLLMPVFIAISLNPPLKDRRWMWVGFAFGFAIALRPESVLILPFLWFGLPGNFAKKMKSSLILLLGALIALGIVAILEKSLTGRWFTPQIQFNLSREIEVLNFSRLADILKGVTSAPIPWNFYLCSLSLLGLAALLWKKPFIFAFGLPILSIISLIWAFLTGPAYGITASSQGIFFAFPWLAVGFLSSRKEKAFTDPLFIIGWGTILTTLLIGPSLPGMHWGPRFLFPAFIPLILHGAKTLEKISMRSSKLLMIATEVVAILYAAGSVGAGAERGSACKKVEDAIIEAGSRILILERWFEGADLEPLWDNTSLVRISSASDLEEFLLELQRRGCDESISWIRSGMIGDLETMPIHLSSRWMLPNRAGWYGELVKGNLKESSDETWGQLYWHAAIRRAEKGDSEGALMLFKEAVNLKGNLADLRYDYAICLGKMGRLPEAADQLKITLELNPEHQPAGELWRQIRFQGRLGSEPVQ